jgi:hypothetical protein
MAQEIITYIILLVTLVVTINNVIRFFTKQENVKCGGCSQANSGCKISHIKQNLNREISTSSWKKN